MFDPVDDPTRIMLRDFLMEDFLRLSPWFFFFLHVFSLFFFVSHMLRILG